MQTCVILVTEHHVQNPNQLMPQEHRVDTELLHFSFNYKTRWA